MEAMWSLRGSSLVYTQVRPDNFREREKKRKDYSFSALV